MKMRVGSAAAAAILALAPVAAFPTTFSTIAPNQISIGYTQAGADLVLVVEERQQQIPRGVA